MRPTHVSSSAARVAFISASRNVRREVIRRIRAEPTVMLNSIRSASLERAFSFQPFFTRHAEICRTPNVNMMFVPDAQSREHLRFLRGMDFEIHIHLPHDRMARAQLIASIPHLICNGTLHYFHYYGSEAPPSVMIDNMMKRHLWII